MYCRRATARRSNYFGRGLVWGFFFHSFILVCLLVCVAGRWQATSARSPLVSILQHRMCARYRANFADKPGVGERGGYGDDGDRDDGDDDDGDDITIDGCFGGGWWWWCMCVWGGGGCG